MFRTVVSLNIKSKMLGKCYQINLEKKKGWVAFRVWNETKWDEVRTGVEDVLLWRCCVCVLKVCVKWTLQMSGNNAGKMDAWMDG